MGTMLASFWCGYWLNPVGQAGKLIPFRLMLVNYSVELLFYSWFGKQDMKCFVGCSFDWSFLDNNLTLATTTPNVRWTDECRQINQNKLKECIRISISSIIIGRRRGRFVDRREQQHQQQWQCSPNSWSKTSIGLMNNYCCCFWWMLTLTFPLTLTLTVIATADDVAIVVFCCSHLYSLQECVCFCIGW